MKKFHIIKTKTEKHNKLAIKEIVTVLSVLIGVAAIIIYGAYISVTEVEYQVQQNLTDVATQNAMILKSRLHEKHELLNALSNELDDVDKNTIQKKLSYYSVLLNDFNLKRFAYCFPDGTTYSTDGDIVNLSYREFFKKGMDGKCCITGVINDAIQQEHDPVNVMTIPMYDSAGKVSGVFGLTYDTSIFNTSLSVDSFDGQGYSCIIDENANIIAAIGNDELQVSSNLLDNILCNYTDNDRAINDLNRCISQNTTGNGTFHLSTGNNFYSCVPVNLMDDTITWHIITIIPDEVLGQRVEPILRVQYITSVLIILVVLIGSLCIILIIKEQHTQLMQFAYEDPVTHGNNYSKFRMEIEKLTNLNGYLVDMSIANFNNISIVAGHEASDTMINDTYNIIRSLTGKDDLVCHMRDDSFLMFIAGTDEAVLLDKIEHISKQIAAKAKNLKVYGIQAKYGVYKLTESETLDSAYSKARIAKEFANTDTHRNYAVYDEIDRVKMQHEKQLEERFQTAIDNNEFEVWYQPKFSASDCTIDGAEALVRWRNPDGSMISPGEFIPLFEKNGMIMKLDEYMFHTVCHQQKAWLNAGFDVLPVSINLSRASLYSTDVHKHYSHIIQEYGIAPEYIQLEITESVMEKGADICVLLNKFRKMGIKILMDDFGTGYSSFATLSTQCFDTLKLDKSLIDHIGNKDGETMLYHIIRMGQQMRLHITAEGVEYKDQLTFLQNLKCDDIQGFYFSKPLPAAEYETYIKH